MTVSSAGVRGGRPKKMIDDEIERLGSLIPAMAADETFSRTRSTRRSGLTLSKMKISMTVSIWVKLF